MRLSANLGFLFTDLPFTNRIGAAAAVGFDALEFHDDPQGCDPGALSNALEKAGLPVLSLNTRKGATSGCAAIPGREDQALAEFRTALAVADRINCRAIHVMSGQTDAADTLAILSQNLARFADLTDRILLIEPLSARAMPGYALRTLDQAAEVIARASAPNLRILFDCYHVTAEGEEIEAAFVRHRDQIGHVQIASFPEREEPRKELRPFVEAAKTAGIDALGCEFHPRKGPDAQRLRRALAL